MIDSLQNILVQVSDFLWSYIIITVLICCALFFTWRTRFVQFRLIKEMVRLLLNPDKVQPEEIGQDELSMEVKVDGEMKHISSFQAFVVALASRIGTGNLAGVATAINLVKDDIYDKFVEDVTAKFAAKYGHAPEIYPVIISEGSHKVC